MFTMQKQLWTGVLLMIIFFSSCTKETSVETGGGGAAGCRVKSLVLVDSTSGAAQYALNTLFNALAKAQTIEAVDSLSKQVDFTQPLVYNKDSILFGNDQYILLDSISRVKKFQLLEDPTDVTSQMYVFQYKYDANGYLLEKTLSTKQTAATVLNYAYTWVGGNLTRVEGKITVGTATIRVFLAELGYDTSIEPLNFIYIFPEATESFLYLNALNYGKKNKNLLKSMTIVYYDQQGIQTDKYVSTIRNAKLNADKQVTEWMVDGDSFDPYGIFLGKMRFDYFCR